MHAIQMFETGGPDVLQYHELPDPAPGEGEVLVRMAAVGIAKPDYLMRSGKYRWMPPLPVIPGNEMAGTIEALGPGVDGLSEGQRVLVWGWEQGCYTELGAYGVHRIQPLPDNVSFDAAVSIPNYLVAWAILFAVPGGRKAERVYVNGAAGGVGSTVIDICKAKGIEVIAGASNADKCAFCADLGAAHTIDYSQENVVDRLNEITDGKGVSLFLDQIVGPHFTSNLEALSPLGTIVSFNALGGLPEDELFAAMRGKLGNALGVRCFSWHCYDQEPELAEPVMAAVMEMMAAGELDPPVHDRLPLKDAAHAHQLLDDRAIMGKLVLVP